MLHDARRGDSSAHTPQAIESAQDQPSLHVHGLCHRFDLPPDCQRALTLSRQPSRSWLLIGTPLSHSLAFSLSLSLSLVVLIQSSLLVQTDCIWFTTRNALDTSNVRVRVGAPLIRSHLQHAFAPELSGEETLRTLSSTPLVDCTERRSNAARLLPSLTRSLTRIAWLQRTRWA